MTRRVAGVVGQRDVLGRQPADERASARPLARAAAVEPEAPLVRRGDRAEDGRRGRSCAAPGSSRPVARRARRGSTRGGTGRPPAAASGAARPSPRRRRVAVTSSTSTARPAPRASGSAPRSAATGSRRRRHDRRARPTPPRRARAGPDRPRRRTSSRGPASPGTRPAPAGWPRRSTSPPTAKSAGSAGCPGPGDSTTCECVEHLVGRDLVVLHDGREQPRSPTRPGARGSTCRSRGGRPRPHRSRAQPTEEMAEGPMKLGGSLHRAHERHRRRSKTTARPPALSPGATRRSRTRVCSRSKPCSVRIDSAWNWMPR